MKKLDYAKLFTKRKDGYYVARWTVNGKRKCLYDKDPEKLYYKMELAKRPRPVTFGEMAEAWEDNHAQRVGYNTMEAYKAPLRNLCDRYGDLPLSDVSPQMIQALLAELGTQGYARRTVQMYRDIINMVYNHAIVNGKATVNPCSAVSVPRGLHTTRREMPSDEALRAVRESTGEMALFAKICLYAGLRRGEVLALRYEDIDRQRGVIHVTKAVEYIGNDAHIKEPKTDAGKRDVALLSVLAKEIPQGSGYIFHMDDGRPLTKISIRKRWLRYCKDIGHDITPHQLRHGYATILFEAGVEDKVAQELLGHSTIAVTRDIYTHIRQAKMKDTIAQLESFIGT